MTRPRKYIEGKVLTPIKAIEAILNNRYVIERGRPLHPSFMLSRHIRDVAEKARIGRICEALENPDHKENQK